MNNTDNTTNILPISIEEEMQKSFIDYSMSVIVSRALPDVRDGLKPVHRRILYAMHGLKNTYNKPYLKSARIVGDVIGKYHPHGDVAVYDALVRMAQPFSLRCPLINGQGNFGSLDGDSAAAMRYTESRMHKISDYMLADLDQDTVDFVPNYDNKDTEPVVLPAVFPQLLVNGSSGIAVGMATNIPPHNLEEVISGLKAFIFNPNITVSQLLEHIKGPDFPTGGEIHGIDGIIDAYTGGRGSITMRAKANTELIAGSSREQIIVTEIPFQQNKAKIIEKIADLVRARKLEGISDLRDESAKSEVRIVIELRKGETSSVVLNNLYKLTSLQTTFGINMVALVKGRPKLLGLKEVLQEFYSHRQQVVLRRTACMLATAEHKAHLLAGLKVAVEHADNVVDVIRKAQDTASAQQQLQERYDLSALQAKAILDMRLARLTGLERDKIVEEHKKIKVTIEDYKDILSNFSRVREIILDELTHVNQVFADARRTIIVASDLKNFSMEKLIANENVAVIITRRGYIKRTALTDISSQRRGGKGRSGIIVKDEDFVEHVFTTSNHQSLLCFSNIGKVYNLKVYEVPESALRTRGTHIANLIALASEENLVAILPVKQFKSDLFVVSITSAGYVKKTDLMAYSNVRSGGIIGLKLDDNDSLVACGLVKANDDVVIATRQGKAIRFKEADIRSMGRVSRGVTGIRFSQKEERVIGLAILSYNETVPEILSVCENGYGKRTSGKSYRTQTRGGKGTYTIKVTERNGPVVGIVAVNDDDDVMLMTESGQLVRIAAKGVSKVGRLAQGVKLMDVGASGKIISVGKTSSCKDEQSGSEE